MPYVFSFDHKHRRPPMEYKDLLGGKGANLAEMTSVLKLPVPPGFTISTDACRAHMESGWPDGLDDENEKQIAKLEKAMGRSLGDRQFAFFDTKRGIPQELLNRGDRLCRFVMDQPAARRQK